MTMRPVYTKETFKCLRCGQPAIHPMHDRCVVAQVKPMTRRQKVDRLIDGVVKKQTEARR